MTTTGEITTGDAKPRSFAIDATIRQQLINPGEPLPVTEGKGIGQALNPPEPHLDSRSSKRPMTRARSVNSLRELRSPDTITSNHRRLHSRGYDAVRQHLDSAPTLCRTRSSMSSRRMRRAKSDPRGLANGESESINDIRELIPRLVQEGHEAERTNNFILPTLSPGMLKSPEEAHDELIRMMVARASFDNEPKITVASSDSLPKVKRMATSSTTRGKFRDLLESGENGKEDLSGDQPRVQLPRIGTSGTQLAEIRRLLGKPTGNGHGVKWSKAELHERIRRFGWCEKHPLGHEDCPRCLMRKLRPSTLHRKRVGGGFIVIEEDKGSKRNFGGHGAWRLLPDGSYELADGSRMLPDGSRLLPDGRRILADGTIVDADGNIIGREGGDGGTLLPDGTRVLADGTRILADGTRVLADGTRVLADGTRVLADGTRVLADGTRILADGTRILADGTKVLADGTRVLADGTRILADGTKILADGTRILADGTRILADGTRILADGTVLDADGNVIKNPSEEDKKRRRAKKLAANAFDLKATKAKKEIGEYLDDLQSWIIEKHDGAMPADESEAFFDKHPHHKAAHKKYQAAVQWGKVANVVSSGAVATGSWNEAIQARDKSFRKISQVHDDLFTYAEHPTVTANKERVQDMTIEFERALIAAAKAVVGSHSDEVKRATNESIVKYEQRLASISEEIIVHPDVCTTKYQLSKAKYETASPEQKKVIENCERTLEHALITAAKESVGEDSNDISRAPAESMDSYSRRLSKLVPGIAKGSRVETARTALTKAQTEEPAPTRPGCLCVNMNAIKKKGKGLSKLGSKFNRGRNGGLYGDDDDENGKRKNRLRDLDASGSKGRGLHDETMMFLATSSGVIALEYLAKYCILSEEQIRRYRTVFENIDTDNDGKLSHNEVGFGLRTVNKSLITSKELDFVDAVLETKMVPEINFRMFAVIAALSERVVDLDKLVRGMVNSMKISAMSKKMMACKQMYYLLDEHNDGLVEMDMLVREVRAGRVTQEHEDIIIEKFSEGGKVYVDFLDYLTYVPLFMEIHDTINDDPLEFVRDK